jgi:hypothetical protein
MNLRFPIGLLLAGFVATGCMHHSAHSQSGAAQTGDGTAPSPIITLDNSLTAKVVRYNSLARFVVLSFPVGQMPQAGQTLFLYRAGMKVGEVKVGTQEQDNDVVADITSGDAQVGDEVRQQ